MKKAIIAGASGLIGKELVEQLIQSNSFDKIILLNRRPLPVKNDKIEQLIIDFNHMNLVELPQDIDVAFCTLGTTIKQAGTKEKFREVDFQYVMAFATLVKKHNVDKLITISSMGANPGSSIFYNRVKGETEQALQKMEFRSLIILRPSLLLGDRVESRPAEKLSAFIMLLFKPLIPVRYRAIKASQVAAFMVNVALCNSEKIVIAESDVLTHFSLVGNCN